MEFYQHMNPSFQGKYLMTITVAHAAFFFTFDSSAFCIIFATSILISRHLSGVQTSPIAFKANAWISGLSLFCKSFFIVDIDNNKTCDVLSITIDNAL